MHCHCTWKCSSFKDPLPTSSAYSCLQQAELRRDNRACTHPGRVARLRAGTARGPVLLQGPRRLRPVAAGPCIHRAPPLLRGEARHRGRSLLLLLRLLVGRLLLLLRGVAVATVVSCRCRLLAVLYLL